MSAIGYFQKIWMEALAKAKQENKENELKKEKK